MLSRFNHVELFLTLWIVACQALLSLGFSRQEYWSGLPCPLPEGLPHPGIKPRSPALQVDSIPLSHQVSRNIIILYHLFITVYCFILLFIDFVLFHFPPIGLEYLHPISGKLVMTCKMFAK